MKKQIILILFALLCGTAMAQNTVEVVYLNNGSIIKGTIIEQSKEGVKIQTRDGSVFVYNMDEVERITKEQTNNNPVLKTSTPNRTFLPIGRMERDGASLTLNGRELTDNEVLELIGSENYEKTYVGAQKQYKTGQTLIITAIPTTAVGFVFTILGSVLTVYESTSFIGMAISGEILLGTGAGALFPAGITLKSIGKGRLNWITDDYNESAQKNYSLNIAPCVTKSPIGTNSYAYGATVKFSF